MPKKTNNLEADLGSYLHSGLQELRTQVHGDLSDDEPDDDMLPDFEDFAPVSAPKGSKHNSKRGKAKPMPMPVVSHVKDPNAKTKPTITAEERQSRKKPMNIGTKVDLAGRGADIAAAISHKAKKLNPLRIELEELTDRAVFTATQTVQASEKIDLCVHIESIDTTPVQLDNLASATAERANKTLEASKALMEFLHKHTAALKNEAPQESNAAVQIAKTALSIVELARAEITSARTAVATGRAVYAADQAIKMAESRIKDRNSAEQAAARARIRADQAIQAAEAKAAKETQAAAARAAQIEADRLAALAYQAELEAAAAREHAAEQIRLRNAAEEIQLRAQEAADQLRLYNAAEARRLGGS
jgi:hypothetical protein